MFTRAFILSLYLYRVFMVPTPLTNWRILFPWPFWRSFTIHDTSWLPSTDKLRQKPPSKVSSACRCPSSVCPNNVIDNRDKLWRLLCVESRYIHTFDTSTSLSCFSPCVLSYTQFNCCQEVSLPGYLNGNRHTSNTCGNSPSLYPGRHLLSVNTLLFSWLVYTLNTQFIDCQ